MRKVFVVVFVTCLVLGGGYLMYRHYRPGKAVKAPGVTTPETAQAQSALGHRTKAGDCRSDGTVPDSACTPGAVFADVTAAQVCRPHYTETVRDVPVSLKRAVFRAYGIPWELHANYEVDHHVSLELGGSNDIANLWPEPYGIPSGARIKDKVENFLHREVCGGRMPLASAQQQIATDWISVYQRMPVGTHHAHRR